MIKLADILKEMAMEPTPKTDYDQVIKAANAMGASNPILWRGIKGGKSIVTHVTGDRENFRGSHELGAKIIMQELGIKYPVFCYFEKSLVQLFGTPCAIILNQPYKIYQSGEVDDVMTYAQRAIYKTTNMSGGTLRQQTGTRSEEEIAKMAKDGAATYAQITNGKPLHKNREVIVDVKDYWALPTDMISRFVDAGDNIPKTKLPKDYSTYADVIQGLTFLKEYFELNSPQPKS